MLEACSTQPSCGIVSFKILPSSKGTCSKNIDPAINNDLLNLFALTKKEEEVKMTSQIYYEFSCDNQKVKRFILFSKYLYSIAEDLKLEASLKNKLVLNLLPKICLGQIDLQDKGDWFTTKVQEKKIRLDENYLKNIKELSCKNKVYTEVTGIIKQYKKI